MCPVQDSNYIERKVKDKGTIMVNRKPQGICCYSSSEKEEFLVADTGSLTRNVLVGKKVENIMETSLKNVISARPGGVCL